ncbi:MAG: alpha/beta fold hydrolase, partial [Planctomycetota bacterium]
VLVFAAAGCGPSVATIPEGMSFQQWRDSRPNDLNRIRKAPQEYKKVFIGSAELVEYPSNGSKLKAWLKTPNPQANWDPNPGFGRAPALVFLHGGFAFGKGDLDFVRQAITQGYVVMAPMLRGENGNPGNFELFLGEVDDAAAAARWLRSHPRVDPERIYVFGHSVGGGVSAMLSLLDDVPIRHSGSSGGLYPPAVFDHWSDIVPFKATPEARSARLLISNIRLMKRQHFAYLGTEDVMHDAARQAKSEMAGLADPLLELKMVNGDHFSSFEGSLSEYLRICAKDDP